MIDGIVVFKKDFKEKWMIWFLIVWFLQKDFKIEYKHFKNYF